MSTWNLIPLGMITSTAVAGFAGLADSGSIASSSVTSNSRLLASDWFVLGKFISTGSCLAPPVVHRSKRHVDIDAAAYAHYDAADGSDGFTVRDDCAAG